MKSPLEVSDCPHWLAGSDATMLRLWLPNFRQVKEGDQTDCLNTLKALFQFYHARSLWTLCCSFDVHKTHIPWEKEEKQKKRKKERRKERKRKKKERKKGKPERQCERRLGTTTALLMTLRSTWPQLLSFSPRKAQTCGGFCGFLKAAEPLRRQDFREGILPVFLKGLVHTELFHSFVA